MKPIKFQKPVKVKKVKYSKPTIFTPSLKKECSLSRKQLREQWQKAKRKKS